MLKRFKNKNGSAKRINADTNAAKGSSTSSSGSTIRVRSSTKRRSGSKRSGSKRRLNMGSEMLGIFATLGGIVSFHFPAITELWEGKDVTYLASQRADGVPSSHATFAGKDPTSTYTLDQSINKNVWQIVLVGRRMAVFYGIPYTDSVQPLVDGFPQAVYFAASSTADLIKKLPRFIIKAKKIATQYYGIELAEDILVNVDWDNLLHEATTRTAEVIDSSNDDQTTTSEEETDEAEDDNDNDKEESEEEDSDEENDDDEEEDEEEIHHVKSAGDLTNDLSNAEETLSAALDLHEDAEKTVADAKLALKDATYDVNTAKRAVHEAQEEVESIQNAIDAMNVSLLAPATKKKRTTAEFKFATKYNEASFQTRKAIAALLNKA